MSFLKRLFSKDKPSAEEHRGGQLQEERKPQEFEEEQIQKAEAQEKEPQQEPEEEQVHKEEQQVVHELAATRKLLLAIEQRKAEYVLDTDTPMMLDMEEDRIREQVAELENRCIALGIEPVEDALMMKEHRTYLLAKAYENLLLIESRKETYKSETDIPIQLTKAEQRLRARIAELKDKVGEE